MKTQTQGGPWAQGVAWLAGGDDARALASARGYLGRMVKAHGLESVSAAIQAGMAMEPAHPRAWLYSTLTRRPATPGATVWQDGLDWLTGGDPGQERRARGLLGRLVRDHGRDAVGDAITQGMGAGVLRSPGAWLVATLRRDGAAARAQRVGVLL